MSAENFPPLELRPTLGDAPRWVVVGAIFIGLAFGTLALYAIFELVPDLNRLFYPASFPVLAGVFVTFLGLLMAFLLLHRVILSPQAVEVRWGPYRKSLATDSIEAVFYLEERNRRSLGAVGRPATIMFGMSFSGHDFERARSWLRAFAEAKHIPYRVLQNRKELIALVFEHSFRKG